MYMNNLTTAIKDVSLAQIYNCDETNLSKEPGNKKFCVTEKLNVCRKIGTSAKCQIL